MQSGLRIWVVPCSVSGGVKHRKEAISMAGTRVQEPIYILGAGPAGLAAAYTLTKQGQQVVVIERDAKVGGLSKSITYQGFTMDYGSHFLATDKPVIEELFNEILKDEQIFLSPMTGFYWRKQYLTYPPQLSEIFGSLGGVETVKAIWSIFYARIVHQKQPQNYAEQLSFQYGNHLFEHFFRGYIEKVWGVPCTDLSANCVASRAIGVFQSILNRLISIFAATELSDDHGLLAYPRHGLGAFYDGIADCLCQQYQQSILLDTEVIEIRHQQSQVSQIVLKNLKTNQKTVHDCRAIVSSIPLTVLMKQMMPSPPAHLLSNSKSLKYRSVILVYLIINGSNLFPEHCLYVIDPQIPLTRITNYANWSQDMLASLEQTPLCCEYWCDLDDSTWTLSESQLLEQTVSHLRTMGLLEKQTICGGFAVRLPFANPVYTTHYQSILANIQDYLQGFQNLQIVGRGGSFSYSDQDRILLMGMDAAQQILTKLS
jgi:protoporphyrinogen oxidase